MHRYRVRSEVGEALLHIPICHFSFLREIAGKALKRVSQYISTNPKTLSKNLPFDEATLIKTISSQLSASKTANDVSLFNSCYEQLQTCVSSSPVSCDCEWQLFRCFGLGPSVCVTVIYLVNTTMCALIKFPEFLSSFVLFSFLRHRRMRIIGTQ